jgi:hypothetical protein
VVPVVIVVVMMAAEADRVLTAAGAENGVHQHEAEQRDAEQTTGHERDSSRAG